MEIKKLVEAYESTIIYPNITNFGIFVEGAKAQREIDLQEIRNAATTAILFALLVSLFIVGAMMV